MDIESELAVLISAGEQMCVPPFLIFLRDVPGSMDLSRRTTKVPLLNPDHRKERSLIHVRPRKAIPRRRALSVALRLHSDFRRRGTGYSCITIAVLNGTQVEYTWHGRKRWGEFNIPLFKYLIKNTVSQQFLGYSSLYDPRNIANRGVLDGRVE